MKKILQVGLIIVCVLSFLIGCDGKEETSASVTGSISEKSYGSIEEFLEGDWVVGAVNIEGTGLVDISDVDALTDMYDTSLITFEEDHEFFYYNHLYPYTGHYRVFDDGERILLVPEVTLKYPDDEWVKEPFEEDFNFLVTILDENTISVVFYYPETGEMEPDNEATLYERDGEISQYIETHKYNIYENR